MTGWRYAAGAAAALLAAATSTAAAQEKCDMNTGNPFQLRSAEIYMSKLNTGKPSEIEKHAQNTVEVLTKDADKIKNVAGRNYLLGRILAWWAARDGVGFVVRRGDVGYVTEPDAQINLAAAIDTALDAVEATMPECTARADTVRRQVWTGQINAASKNLNDDLLDSAEVYLDRADMLMADSPYNAYFRAVLTQKKNQPAAELFYKAYELATEEAKTDSNVATIRRQSLYNAGVLTLEEANAMEESARAPQMKLAAERFETFLAEYPDAPQASNVQGALARALATSGDTAAAVGLFARMLEQPQTYTPLQLFEASVAAVRADRTDDAIRLIELGMERNPYYRDAIFNLATLYHRKKEFEKMMPLAEKLLELDPNNPDNYRIYAGALQGPAEALKIEAEKLQKERGKRAQFDATMKKLQAQNDSVLKYVQLSQEAPVRVVVQQMQSAGATTTLTGTIENRSESPKTFDLKFDFLDAQGNVVASESTTVETDANGTKSFRIETGGQGIVGWRYAPVI
jgi:tetratricopeptide (TPR) repeat protein